MGVKLFKNVVHATKKKAKFLQACGGLFIPYPRLKPAIKYVYDLFEVHSVCMSPIFY